MFNTFIILANLWLMGAYVSDESVIMSIIAGFYFVCAIWYYIAEQRRRKKIIEEMNQIKEEITNKLSQLEEKK